MRHETVNGEPARGAYSVPAGAFTLQLSRNGHEEKDETAHHNIGGNEM